MSVELPPSAPTGLSGEGFNALTIYPNATAVIKGGTYDARHIVALGTDIYAGAYGLFVDDDATATVCDAELIKGGEGVVEVLDKQLPVGTGAAYVASGATLNIAGGLFEGGRGFDYVDEQGTESAAPGIFASYQGPEATNLVITGGKILGGPVERPSGGMYRGSAISMFGAGTVNVYGGEFGDEHTNLVLTMEIGYDGLFGDTDGILNIYGGEWPTKSTYPTQMFASGYNGGRAFVNIFGKDLQRTTIPPFLMTLRVIFAMVLIFTINCTVITLSQSQMTALATSNDQASLYVASLVSLVSLASPPRDHLKRGSECSMRSLWFGADIHIHGLVELETIESGILMNLYLLDADSSLRVRRSRE